MGVRSVLPFFVVVGCGGSPLPADGSGPAEARPLPNVVLITLDTTRADRIGAYGYELAKTDQIDALAASGRRYAHAYSPLPLTIPAHASMFTGKYPAELGIRSNGSGMLSRVEVTLAERLKDAGYATAASVAAFVTTRQWGFNQGFDEYFDEVPEAEGNFWHAYRPGDEVVDDILGWHEAQTDDSPEFAWVHLYDAHFPYTPSEEYWKLQEGRPYDAEVAYLDDQVARLVEAYAEEPTVFVIAADHGEGLGDHGELTHGLYAYNATQHVPWLMSGPGVDVAVVDEPVSLVDMTPTILELLGLEPLKDVTGIAVPKAGEETEARPIYMETWQLTQRFGIAPHLGVVLGDRKLLDLPQPELYHIDDDLAEDGDLSHSEPEKLGDLKAALEGFGFEPPSADPVHVDLDTRAQLQALGYMDAGFSGDLTGPHPDPKDKIDLIRRSQAAERKLMLEEHEASMEMLEGLVKDYPEVVEFKSRLAQAAGRHGDPDRARELIEEALAIDPSNLNLKTAFAVSHARNGDYKGASVLFQEVAEGMTYSPRVRAMAVASLRESGDLVGAVNLAARYLEDYPDDLAVAGLLGVMLVESGKHPEGVALLEMAVAADKPEREVAYYLAAASLGKGDRLEARRLLELETKHYPSNEKANYTLVNVLALTQDWLAEERVLARMLEQEPNDALLLHAQGLALFNQGRYLEAREVINQGLEVAPDLSFLQLMDANLMAKEGKREQGEVRFNSAMIIRQAEEARLEELRRAGVPSPAISVLGVPGAFVPTEKVVGVARAVEGAVTPQ